MRKFVVALLTLFLASYGVSSALENLANNPPANTTLSAGISNNQTSFAVASGASFPASSFTIGIDSELMHVTTNVGNTFQGVTRGIEGTTAASHLANAVIGSYFTAGAASAIALQEVLLCSGSGTTSGSYSCYEYYNNHEEEIRCSLAAYYNNSNTAQSCSFNANSAPGWSSTGILDSNVSPFGSSLTNSPPGSIALPTNMNTPESGVILAHGF